MATARTAERLARRSEQYTSSQFERVLANASLIAVVFLGVVALLVVLKFGQVILAPVWLAVVIGLMFGPVADWFERRGVPQMLSALIIVVMFIALIGLALTLFAVPLADWVGKIPQIWQKLRGQLAALKGPLESIAGLENQLSSLVGGDAAMPVKLQDGNPVINMALFVPEIGAKVLLFLASLYFFMATREHFRISVLSLCVTRRMRWRTAHIFNDVERKVSRFLISVTLLNIGVGVVVALACWVLGLPSPLLWGMLATVLNYTPYVGQAVMIAVLTLVGIGTQSDLTGALLPVGAYVVITLAEGQFITPHILGRTMTLNPFLILLSTTLALWVWGPIGGAVSVPSLLIVQSVLLHVLPSKPLLPRRPVFRTATMTDREEMLANAARAIRERRLALEEGSVADRRQPPPADNTAPVPVNPA